MQTLTKTSTQEKTLINEIKSIEKSILTKYKEKSSIFQPVTNVYSTTKYDTLKTYKANRAIKRHFKGIINSMKEHGNVSIGLVAKINNIYYILDGQHRFEACKTSNIPFEFKLIELENTKDMVNLISALNSTGKSWKDADYLEAWAKENKTAYRWLKELNDDFDNVSLSNLKNIFKWKLSEFKSGEWDLARRDFLKGVRIVKQLNDIKPILFESGKLNAQPMRAVIDAMKHENYNHKKMIQIIKNGCGMWSNDETILRTQLLQEVIQF